MLASVLIDGSAELLYDYLIPKGIILEAGMRVHVPLGSKKTTGTVLSIKEESSIDGLLDYAIRPILSCISPHKVIEPPLLKLAEWMANYYASSLASCINLILPQAVREESTQAKKQLACTLLDLPDKESLHKLKKRAPRQYDALLALQEAGGTLPLHKLNLSSQSILSLQKKGWIKKSAQRSLRLPDAGERFLQDKALNLNPQQKEALQKIIHNIHTPHKPQLLHGITGSGKTEVYLQASAYCLSLDKNVLILLPEIALTPQTVGRFEARFASLGKCVALLHHRLSVGERFDQWELIREGKIRIVIGARSAVFAPLKDIGLIIVDEEHESSYKQQQRQPYYHARDIAVVRGHFEQTAVLLGSATPSLESFFNTQKGKYDKLLLTQRADQQSLPLIRVVDMRLQKTKHVSGILSDPLCQRIEAKLHAGEQIILMLNRKGYANSLQCTDCGESQQCPHCAVALTYHKSEARLICHVCGHRSLVPKRCPSCQSQALSFHGYGTEQIESLLKKTFPHARIARLDAQISQKKNAPRDLLTSFRQHKIDILLGTQMIAKGLDFPRVTLVGVLNADIGLCSPDFRAGESTFSLLTQVAGRAGRGELEGEVIIQTFTPHSPSIQFARHHDFNGFAEQELLFREQLHYPPFTHYALLQTRSTHEERAAFTLQNIHQRLAKECPAHITLGEPFPSSLTRAHDEYRYELSLRSPHAKALSQFIAHILKKTPPPPDVQVLFDMDARGF